MINLINDEIGFCDLFDKPRQVKSQLDYLQSFKAEFAKELAELCAREDSYLADGAYVQLARELNIEHKDVLEQFANMTFERKFTDFNIAIYEGFANKNLKNLVKKSGAKIVEFQNYKCENGYRYLSFDADAAYAQAGKVVLDAYDCGADFLLVNDAASFLMFDTKSNKLQAAANRDFSDFYVLTSAEFIALASGKTPSRLQTHKLKVRLL